MKPRCVLRLCWNNMFNSFWKWVCVYLGCRLVGAMRDSKSMGWRDGHIKAEFSISSQFLLSSAGRNATTQVVEVTTVFGHPLTSTATSLAWSVAEISQIWEQERFVTEVKADRGGEDEGEKCLAAGAASVLVWRKSWHELHLSVVIERISRVWFGDVRKWTELPQLTGILVHFSSHSGCVAVHWMCNTLGMVAVFIYNIDEVNPGKSHYLLWSSLIKYQSQS